MVIKSVSPTPSAGALEKRVWIESFSKVPESQMGCFVKSQTQAAVREHDISLRAAITIEHLAEDLEQHFCLHRSH